MTLVNDSVNAIHCCWENHSPSLTSSLSSLSFKIKMTTSLLTYDNISKKHHITFLTVCTTVRNQHITFLNKNHIYVQWLMRQNLLSQNLFLYKENIAIKENKNDNDLRKVNEDVQLLHTDQKNRICIICCSDESMLIQNESSMYCQIWETNLYNTYIIVVAAVVATECVVQESVLKGVN